MGWFQFPQVQLTWFVFLKNLVASVVKFSSCFSVCNDIELLTHSQEARSMPFQFRKCKVRFETMQRKFTDFITPKRQYQHHTNANRLTIFKKSITQCHQSYPEHYYN